MGQISDYINASSITGALTTTGNIISQYMANRANMRLADQANQWSIDQWNRENEYNLPINQIKRLREAGINPGLMYGDGGMMNEAAQSPGVTSAAGSVRPYVMDPLAMAQVANLNAQTAKTNAETQTENDLRAARYRELWLAGNNMEAQVQDIASKIAQRAKQNDLTDAQIKDISFDQLMRQKAFSLDEKRLENETNLSEAQVKKLSADTEKALAEANVSRREYDEMIYTFAVRYAGLQSAVRLTDAQINQANATASKLGADEDFIKAQTDRYANDPEGMQRTAEGKAMAGEYGTLPAVLTMVKYQVKDAVGTMGNVLRVGVGASTRF